MNSDNNKIWISAYLFYPEPWEEFLVHGVSLFVKQRRQRGVIQQFFFIRYWENGAHIRLRLKCNVDIQAQLKQDIEEHFYSYYRTVESIQFDPNTSLAKTFRIEFVNYTPEIERYGGIATMPFAERQFELSSDTVLSIITSKPGWNYQKTLGYAIQMHLSFAVACKMDINEAINFFRYVSKAGDYIGSEYNDQIIRAFEKSFSEQKSFLIPYCKMLWSAMAERRSFEESWINSWIAESENIHGLYQKSGQQLVVRRAPYGPELIANAVFDIYSSFVHMTNNRIGILNQDESYLAYILVNSLTEMKKNQVPSRSKL